MRVMVTQTWAWLRAQLDFHPSKRIKVHILRDGERRSLCGLVNRENEGEMSWPAFLQSEPCERCIRKAQATEMPDSPWQCPKCNKVNLDNPKTRLLMCDKCGAVDLDWTEVLPIDEIPNL
jgi:hypothetical protein